MWKLNYFSFFYEVQALDAPCPTFGASSAVGRAISPRPPRPHLAVNWRQEKLNLRIGLSLTYQGGCKRHGKRLSLRARLSGALRTSPRCLLHPQWSPCEKNCQCSSFEIVLSSSCFCFPSRRWPSKMSNLPKARHRSQLGIWKEDWHGLEDILFVQTLQEYCKCCPMSGPNDCLEHLFFVFTAGPLVRVFYDPDVANTKRCHKSTNIWDNRWDKKN